MTGVMASITPNITPVRKASTQPGLCSANPLPIAAAKASVDMAKASRAIDAGFNGWPWKGRDFGASLNHKAFHKKPRNRQNRASGYSSAVPPAAVLPQASTLSKTSRRSDGKVLQADSATDRKASTRGASGQ